MRRSLRTLAMVLVALAAATAPVAAAGLAGGAPAVEGTVADGPTALDGPATGGDPVIDGGHGAAPTARGAVQPCSYPFSVTDATGTEVTIEGEPESVVTMAPSAAQTAWDLGAREKVVGVSQLAAYLPNASEKANISAPGFGTYNVERMVALEPDVVLAPNVIPNRSVRQVREAGLTVVRLPKAKTIDDVRRKTTLIGRLVGECENAERLNEWMDRNLDGVRSAVEGADRPRAMYVTAGYVAGDNTFIHDMMTVAGARNVVAEAGISSYKPVNREVVADRDPEWIVLSNPRSTVPQKAPYNSTTAVQEGNVLQVDANYISQPAPRSVVYAVRNMTEAFHPDAYGPDQYVSMAAVMDPEPTTTTTTTTDTTTAMDTTTETTADETTTATTMGGDTTTETAMDGDGGGDTTAGDGDGDGGGGGQGQPGLGIGIAVVALIAAIVVLARRR